MTRVDPRPGHPAGAPRGRRGVKRSEAPSQATPEALALTRELFTALEGRRVRYCHWKSTPGLATALAGRTDLDLLVDRRDAASFAIVLAELGFKQFLSHESRRYPGVEDHLGFDEPSGRLVHLHIYFQLVLGEDYVKNHHLPFERVLLEQSELRHGVRVPRVELELAILAMRALLKYRDTDSLKDRFRLGRSAGLPGGILGELRELGAMTTPERVRDAVDTYLPGVPGDAVAELLEVVQTEPRDAARLLRLRRRVRAELARYERLPWHQAKARYLSARLVRQWPMRLLTRTATRRQARRKSPAAGGVTIAIVGSDGAGKSTVIREIADWLGWRVNLRVLYLGSAQPSPPTHALKFSARGARAVARLLARRLGADSRPAAAARLLSGGVTAARRLADANDRLRRARLGARAASHGSVVVFDRYPLTGVTLDGRTMDGPRIATDLRDQLPRPLLRRLDRVERVAYARLPAPSHLLVLQVSPEVARARKADHDPAVLGLKTQAIADFARSLPDGTDAIVIDAERPLDEVVREVKARIWALL